MRKLQRFAPNLSNEQATRCLELWATGRMDTLDIARVIGCAEASVARLIQAARDIRLSLTERSQ